MSVASLGFADLGLDDECDGNGTLVNDKFEWNSDEYFYCELPTVIAVNDTIELNDENEDGDAVLWALPGIVTVGNGHVLGATPSSVVKTTLKIGSGARIVGAIGNSALVITRGSVIDADGSASNPIIFSSLDDDFTGRGEWGGLILSGFGVSNKCPGTGDCEMEGISDGTYYYGGGANTSLSSGTLDHVVITEGGHDVILGGPTGSGDEINGLTLYAVNSSTSITNVHVNENLDDGIEFFGGNVSVTNLWLTCNQDDSVDWDEGYQGSLTNVQIIQRTGDADHAFELANNPDDFDAAPVANGSVTNVSIFLTSPGSVGVPFKLKEGTDARFTNVVMDSGYTGACDDAADINRVTTSDISRISHSCTSTLLPGSDATATGFTTASFWTAAQGNPGCN